MFKWIFSLLILTTTLYALEVSLQGAKENFENYSTLHIRDRSKFLCQEIKNNFDLTTKIVCAFSKSPSKKFRTLQDDFFKIEGQIKKRTFFLIITPFKKIKLYPMIFNLSVDDSIYSPNVKLAKHWMVIGYKENKPYIKHYDSSELAINFPFFSDRNKLPFVGSLDIKGNPVHIEQVGDVSSYLKIKEYYDEGKYEKCLALIDDVLFEYPTSLFSAELLYYKIRVNSKMKDDDGVVENSKIYLREYSSDENIAEVLALSAKSYALLGQSSQADYFFDRLFEEHKESPYAKWGYIYRGEMLEELGAFSVALEYYEKALHDSTSIDIAATAAYKLARYKVNNFKKREASKYIEKIIKVKPTLFFSKYETSLDMMIKFADLDEYLSAAYIAKAILDEIDMDYDNYESLLKNRGIWLSKTAKKQEALIALNNYLKRYPDGGYEQEVQIAKDSLFFDIEDANQSKSLEDYDLLIETYGGDSIGYKAIYEKAKLMYERGMYREVLEFKDPILSLDTTTYPDRDSIIDDAAFGVMKEALQKRECSSILKISAEYSLKLSDKWDDGIYDCAMRGADFLLAKKIANKNLKSKNLNIRKKWLYRYIKVDFATANYSDVIEASEELITLIEDDKNSKYKDIYRLLFDTYQRLENSNKMIESILNIEKRYGINYIDIERYMGVMTIGNSRKDDNLVLNYGTKVMQIQNSSDSYAQSPFVEFTLYQSYINLQNYDKALKVIKSLDSVEISKAKRARQKYLLGAVYEKLWRGEEAQIAYQEAIEADASSAWAKLAEGAKEN